MDREHLVEAMALSICDTGLLEGDEAMDAARAALAAIRETHAIVPKEPTEAMLDAAYARARDQAGGPLAYGDAWQAMIEAA